MDKGSKLLSDLVVYSKYAGVIEENGKKRKETWDETVDRYQNMLVNKYPDAESYIIDACKLVRNKTVLPSMRALQFAGPPILKRQARCYNCCALPMESPEAFQEIMWLLLCGCGVGFSVEHQYIDKLPSITVPVFTKKFVIEDSIEGWADALGALMKSYFYGLPEPIFVYDEIRPKGSPISSGGVAPGPEPLRRSLDKVRGILKKKKNHERLTSLEICDIYSFSSDCVMAGGIRRSAGICIFDKDDNLMLHAKDWEVLADNPQRYRTNNSAKFIRHDTLEDEFQALWEALSDGKSGEPGVFWVNHVSGLTNPCVEIFLNPYQFCNLCTVNFSVIKSDEELVKAVWAVAVLGTCQAGFTDFTYLRHIWKQTTEAEALLGISITGLASQPVENFDFDRAAKIAKITNEHMAKIIGINPAARITTVKPEGTSSSVLGTSSGIHAWHSKYYIRNIRFNVVEPIAQYMLREMPEICAPCVQDPENTIVVSIPVAAPEGALFRENEDAITFLERVKYMHEHWVKPGHVSGLGTHNVSSTCNVREHEWSEVGKWMWDNKDYYNGISCFPYDGGVYQQAPFEEITEEEYYTRLPLLKDYDLTKIEDGYVKDHRGESACAGGACQIL